MVSITDMRSLNSDGGYGVIYISYNRKITCATCPFDKTHCMHIQYLSDVCTKVTPELPEELQEYTQLLSQTFTPSLKKYPDFSCLLKAKIPFELSNEMSTIQYFGCLLESVSTFSVPMLPNLCPVVHQLLAALVIRYNKSIQ